MNDAESGVWFLSKVPFQKLLETMPAGVYTCDNAGLITYFNRHAERMWGRRPVLNKRADRYCGSFKLFAEDGTPIEHNQCSMAFVLKTGQPQIGRRFLIERPDGERMTVLAHANPLYDAAGQLQGGINVLTDITEQAVADAAKARLAAIVDSSNDAIIGKTLEGRITSWNAAAERLFGYGEDEVLGKSITLLLPADRQSEEEEILHKIRRGERIEHFETLRRTKDGRLINVSLTISLIRDKSGFIIGASKIARDITAQKRTEQEMASLTSELTRQLDDLQRLHEMNARLCTHLQEVDQRKDEFLATLAHELRNPLAPISNSLNIMRLSGDLGPTSKTMREIMERQVGHLTHLVDDLMEVSRVTRGRIELRKERVNLTTIIATAIESSRPLIDASGHQLAVMLHKTPVTLDADPVRLTQIISNLLNNAAKYTPQGGQIWLTMKYENGTAVISVKDTGLGIEPHMLNRVFDLFTQVDRTTKRSQGGLGIGLSLARSFVEMHGGHIEARSAGLGQGSEFIVLLPAVDEELEQAPTIPHDPAEQLPVHRILIVDDMASSAYTLARLLEKLGQQVFISTDSASAMQQVAETNPDIVISDIAMPDVDGYELAQLIRKSAHPGIILVALTGYGQPSDRERSQQAGFDHHLVKPAGLEEVRQLLRSLPMSGRLTRSEM